MTIDKHLGNIPARMRIRCVLPPPAGQHRNVSTPSSTLSTPFFWCHYRLGLLSVAEIASGKRPLGHSRPCRRQAAHARSMQHAPGVLQLILNGRVPHIYGLHRFSETVLVDADLGHLLLESQRWSRSCTYQSRGATGQWSSRRGGAPRNEASCALGANHCVHIIPL